MGEAYRHCAGCGRGFDQKTWQRESFCGSCGEPLKTQVRRMEPVEIHPYPDPDCRDRLRVRTTINDLFSQLGDCAKQHPYWFSAGTIAAGAGALMLGPGLVTLGQGVMVIGTILIATGMLSVVYTDREQAEKWIASGLMTLAAGAGIALVGFVLTTAGIVAVVGGSGVATKAAVADVLRWRIRQQLLEKNVTELIDLSRRLEC